MEFKSVSTKRGDDGSTDSFGKGRLQKDHVSIQLVGKLDLLQAEIGLTLAFAKDEKYDFFYNTFLGLTQKLQTAIFELNGDIISLPKSADERKSFFDADVLTTVEKLLTDTETRLPPIQNFCYPVGSVLTCQLHKVRALCRETEVVMVKYNQEYTLPEYGLPFINRLSDLFFVLARWVSLKSGTPEDLWKLS